MEIRATPDTPNHGRVNHYTRDPELLNRLFGKGTQVTGISQSFIGTVGPGEEAYLSSAAVQLDIGNYLSYKGGTSTLTIMPLSNARPGGSDSSASHPNFRPSGPDNATRAGKAMKAYNRVMAYEKITSQIYPPLKNTLKMIVYFGDSPIVYQGDYNNDDIYKFELPYIAPMMAIRFRNTNTTSPGFFSFMVNIVISKPPANLGEMTDVNRSDRSLSGFIRELQDTFTEGMSEIDKGNYPR